MKKILSAILLAWISSFSMHAQTSGIIEVTDNVPVPLEQQLATLFSQLNFADV